MPKNSIRLSHNDIYEDLQTVNNHVDLIILTRKENLKNGAVKNEIGIKWPSPSFFFLSFDVMISVILTCFVLFCFSIAKQLAILKILNYLKHATDRLQLPSSPQVVK